MKIKAKRRSRLDIGRSGGEGRVVGSSFRSLAFSAKWGRGDAEYIYIYIYVLVYTQIFSFHFNVYHELLVVGSHEHTPCGVFNL